LRRPPCPTTHRRRPPRALLLLVGLTLAVTLQAATLSARVSPPGPDGTLELTLESGRAPLAAPDLSPLMEGFEILGQRIGHQSFLVNGLRNDVHSLTLTLRPRHPGVTEVPAITYGDDTSQPLHLETAPATPPEPPAKSPTEALTTPMPSPDRPQVQAGPAAPVEASRGTLALEADIQPTTVRVQQQAILTARVYTPEGGGALPRPQLYDPKVPGASILPLGEDHATATRDGRAYLVYERRYALFPSQAGTLTLEPLVVDAWVMVQGQTAPVQLRAESDALSLKVEAQPKLDPGRTWLPAKGVTLREAQTGLAQVQPGGAWQRLVTLTVTGQAAGTLPELVLAAPHQLDTHRGRPRLWDERTPEGVVGTRQEAILVSGNEAGLYRLPEISLDWWNTATGAWETAVLPPRDLQVLAKTPASPPPGSTTILPDAVESRAPVSPPAEGATAPESDSDSGTALGPWTWGIIGLGLCLGAVLLVRRRRPASPAATPAANAAPPDRGPLAPPPLSPLEQLSEDVHCAYANGDASAARAALLAWAQLAWPHNPPGNLTQLALRSPQPAARRIALLDQAFFSPDPLGWNHEHLWEDLPAIAEVAAQEPPPAPPKRRRLGSGPQR
jgi:hypothetical protein